MSSDESQREVVVVVAKDVGQSQPRQGEDESNLQKSSTDRPLSDIDEILKVVHSFLQYYID